MIRPSYKIWLFFLILWTALCGYFFYAVYKEAERTSINELNALQRVYARQAAREIETFFDRWVDRLTAIGHRDGVIHMDEEGRLALGFVFSHNSHEVKAISRMDSRGRILYTVPFDPKLIGRDISGQAHVKKVLATKKNRGQRYLQRGSRV